MTTSQCRWLSSLMLIMVLNLPGSNPRTTANWSESPCPEPGPVANAFRDVTDYDVTYTCYDGYVHVSGDVERTCRENGSYNGTAPQCVLQCQGPLTPHDMFILSGSTRALAGSVLNGFCMTAPVFGSRSVTCDEQLGQWQPWSLVCSRQVAQHNHTLSSSGFLNDSSCMVTEPEAQPYWTAMLSTSLPPTIYDVAAVQVAAGESCKENVTLTVEILNDVNLPCGDVRPSNRTGLTTLVCRTVKGRAPWGHGVKVTATFTGSEPRRLELCDVIVNGRPHAGQCPYPPAIPGLKVSVIANQTYNTGTTVTYSCSHELLPLTGSGLSRCSALGDWSYPSLICTGHENLAKGKVVKVTTLSYFWFARADLPKLTDDDVISAVLPLPSDVTYRVTLGQLVECQYVTVLTLVDFDLSITVTNSENNRQSRACDVIYSSNSMTSAKCRQMYVGDSVDVTMHEKPFLGWMAEIRVFGRVYNGPLSCRRSPQGEEYKGHVSMATSGRACLPWSDVISLDPTFDPSVLPDRTLDEAAAHCRYLSGWNYNNISSAGLACYVMGSSGLDVEPCDAPLCSEICKIRKDGQDYKGTVNVTEDGRACVNWTHPNIRFRRRENFDWLNTYDVASDDWLRDDVASDDWLRDDVADDVADGDWRSHNYCRNPGGSQSGPWCYTDGDTLEYGFCDISPCKKKPSTLLDYHGYRNAKKKGHWLLDYHGYRNAEKKGHCPLDYHGYRDAEKKGH